MIVLVGASGCAGRVLLAALAEPADPARRDFGLVG